MRLIDADLLKEELIKSNKAHVENSREESLLDRTVRIVMEQKTAYDVDKVASEIRRYCIDAVNNGKEHIEVTKFNKELQNILKEGGIDGRN